MAFVSNTWYLESTYKLSQATMLSYGSNLYIFGLQKYDYYKNYGNLVYLTISETLPPLNESLNKQYLDIISAHFLIYADVLYVAYRTVNSVKLDKFNWTTKQLLSSVTVVSGLTNNESDLVLQTNSDILEVYYMDFATSTLKILLSRDYGTTWTSTINVINMVNGFFDADYIRDRIRGLVSEGSVYYSEFNLLEPSPYGVLPDMRRMPPFRRTLGGR